MDSEPKHRLLEPESTKKNHIVAFTVIQIVDLVHPIETA